MITESNELVLGKAFVNLTRGYLTLWVQSGRWDWRRFGAVTLSFESFHLPTWYEGWSDSGGPISITLRPTLAWPSNLLGDLKGHEDRLLGARIRRRPASSEPAPRS